MKRYLTIAIQYVVVDKEQNTEWEFTLTVHHLLSKEKTVLKSRRFVYYHECYKSMCKCLKETRHMPLQSIIEYFNENY